jgi:hypothetical protein
MTAVSTVHGGAAIEPLRFSAADLVDLFDTPEAGTPQWHERRAAALRYEASVHPVAAVNTAYRRLAKRHVATARLLEARLRRGPALEG